MAVIVEISNKVIDTLDSYNLHVHVHTRFFLHVHYLTISTRL